MLVAQGQAAAQAKGQSAHVQAEMHATAAIVQAEAQVLQWRQAHKLNLGRPQVGTQRRLKQRSERGTSSKGASSAKSSSANTRSKGTGAGSGTNKTNARTGSSRSVELPKPKKTGASKSPGSTSQQTGAGKYRNNTSASTSKAGAQNGPAEKYQNHTRAAAKAGAPSR